MTTETRPYQILLAEDSPADIHIVRIALQDQSIDHVLHVVRDGAAAISFIENAEGLDLILLDMHLPKYDGEEILKRLRSTELLAQVPVVVMTSSDSPRDHDTARRHMALFYFRKPSSLEEFRHLGVVVRDILGGKAPSAFDAATAGK